MILTVLYLEGAVIFRLNVYIILQLGRVSFSLSAHPFTLISRILYFTIENSSIFTFERQVVTITSTIYFPAICLFISVSFGERTIFLKNLLSVSISYLFNLISILLLLFISSSKGDETSRVRG